MQAIKCEICGGSDIIKQDGHFVCRYCGTKYSADEVRSLLGTVRIDKSDDTNNCLTLARRYFRETSYDKSAEYYELVLRNDPDNLEAIFYSPFCAAMKSTPETLQYTVPRFSKSLTSVFAALSGYDPDDSDIRAVTDTVFQRILYFCGSQGKAAAEAYRAAGRDPGQAGFRYSVGRGLTEIAGLYYKLELFVRQYHPAKEELIRQIRTDELSLLESSGRLFMNRFALRKEKSRLKKDLR